MHKFCINQVALAVQVGGLTTQELNRLEIEFLFRMGFSLHMQVHAYLCRENHYVCVRVYVCVCVCV
jgi:hypothetical protein